MLSPVGITSKYLQSPVFWILQISLFYVYIYLIICAYFYCCIDFVCKVTFVLSEKLCTEKVANNHSRYFFIKVISICEVAKLVNAS